MELQSVVEGLPVKLAPGTNFDLSQIEIQGVCHDSRRVQPGDLFVAWQGEAFDGRRYASQAVGQGAVAVLASSGGEPCDGVPWLEAADPRRLMGPVSARVFDHPDRDLRLVGITGTNGKTTVSYIVQAILESAGLATGVLGTLGYHFADLHFPGDRTTPEAADFYRCLKGMGEAGAQAVSMEVSSHALAQGRVHGAGYEVAVFTNLTRDHLDYHGDMDSYFEAKKVLFEQLKEDGVAVVNVDDERGRWLSNNLSCRVLSFSNEGDSGAADIAVLSEDLTPVGSKLKLKTPSGTLDLSTRLRGSYNVSNTCAAIAVAEAMGVEHGAIVRAFESFEPVDGRLDPIDEGQSFPVFLDYAHTPGGLDAALTSLRALHTGEVVLVFGCGGDKDQGKRPLMGRVAGELADLPILTNDNPRGEDPEAIQREVIVGLEEAENEHYRVIGDRRLAIRAALQIATDRPHCVVLVAGKGHEREQIIGDEVRSFSDADEIRSTLEELARGETVFTAEPGSPQGGHHGAVDDA